MASQRADLKWVADYWDKLGKSRDARSAGAVWHHGKPVDVYDGLTTYIGNYLDLKSTDSVLEVGCGSGPLISRMQGKVARVAGTDLSQGMLDHLAGSGVETYCCDAASLPMPDASFDKVFFHGVANYFPDHDYLRKALGELIRVTKPGGRLFFGDIFNGRLEDDYARYERSVVPLAAKPRYLAAQILGPLKRRLEYGGATRSGHLGIDPFFFRDYFAKTSHTFFPLLELVDGKPVHCLRYRYDVLVLLNQAKQ